MLVSSLSDRTVRLIGQPVQARGVQAISSPLIRCVGMDDIIDIWFGIRCSQAGQSSLASSNPSVTTSKLRGTLHVQGTLPSLNLDSASQSDLDRSGGGEGLDKDVATTRTA